MRKIKLVLLFFLGHFFTPLRAEEQILNIYSWFDVIPKEILREFEQETGITIHFDVYDSNEVLEAKLLMGSTGYDLVSPSAFPFLARQVPAGIFLPLDMKLIPHASDLDPEIMKRLAMADPGNLHAIPLTWGVVGFAYDRRKVFARVPDAPVDSWAMFFDESVVSRLADCQVTMLEEGGEVVSPLLIYLGILPVEDISVLKRVTPVLQKIRPYIARLDALRSAGDIFAAHACLVQHWVGTLEYTRALMPPGPARDNIRIVVPREGTTMWIDTLVIPGDAPHPRNAHLFMDFLLRPENIARITNFTYFANAVPSSRPFIRREIRENPGIYPAAHDFGKFFVNEVTSPRYNRQLSRLMLKFRTGRWK